MAPSANTRMRSAMRTVENRWDINGGDNRFTSWSATALKTYAGISWDRANAVNDGPAEKQFLKRAESSTKGKPRYELLSASELAAAIFTKKQDALAPVERLLLTEVRERRGKLKYGRRGNSTPLTALLVALGLVRRQGDTYFAIDAPDARVDPDLIWLPNTLVTGTERGDDLPVRRLRSAGDIWTLRLLIDLYHAQNLRDDGSISPTLLWQEFTRMEVGERGIFTVWAFKPEQNGFHGEGAPKLIMPVPRWPIIIRFMSPFGTF